VLEANIHLEGKIEKLVVYKD